MKLVSREETAQRVLKLLQNKAGADRQLTLESSVVSDTGLDSVSVMDVVLELEDQFDVTISLDRLADVNTVDDLASIITELRAEAS